MKDHPATKKLFATLLAIIGWFALILQFYLILQTTSTTGFSTTKAVVNFFSYFTVLTNCLVALCLTALVFRPGSFFTRHRVMAAVAVYIFIVGLVYNLVLRGLVSLSGWNLVADTLLHVIMPLLYVLFWMVFTTTKQLTWKDLFPWLIFPACYLAYSLLRGPIANWYPYPFLNAGKLGYTSVTVNSLGVLAAILVTSLAFIAFNRRGTGASR